MAGDLNGKVGIVTGGASGIGLATVRAFLREGASVVCGDINDVRGAELSAELGEAFHYQHADVTDEGQIEGLVAGAASRFGQLDVIFNNAGAAGDLSAIADLTSAGFDTTIALVARSAVLGHKYAIRQFRKQGSGGSIISTASLAALQGGWSPVCYNMGKHAITGLVKQATAELAGEGIRSNAIAPGIIPTPAMAPVFGIPSDHAEEFVTLVRKVAADEQPIRRSGRPEDIAEAAVFFASDRSAFISGQTLAVDGGATAVYAGGWSHAAADAAAGFRAQLQMTPADARA